MITNDGKSIVGKYLISQAPAYAGFIAVGCGADPKQTASSNITAFAISGSTVTVTATNNFNANTPVIISIPGNRFTTLTNIASANTTNFTYAYGSTLPAITNAVSSSNVVTYTTATAHGLRSGDRVTIANLTSAYNASNVTVNVINTISFSTYVAASGTATAADGAGDFTMNFTPPTNSLVIKDNADKTTLDYEMFRIPITSRGFDSESTINKVVLTGELPTQDRYLMTEIGVFSSGTNPTATTSDSRAVFTFTEGEGWEHHTSVSTTLVTSPVLFQSNPVGVINTYSTTVASEDVFTLNSTNSLFDADAHKLSNAKPRNLSNFIMVRGDLSNINTSGAVWTATSEPHIHLTNQRFAFDANSSIDQLKLAFSVINQNPVSGANAAVSPDNVYVMIEFSGSESETDSENQYARMQVTLTSSSFSNSTNTRYFIATKTFGELATSVGFTWDAVKVVKIYVEVDPPSTLDATVTAKSLSGTGNVTARLLLGALSNKFSGEGERVIISGVGSPFDGTFIINNSMSSAEDLADNWIEYTIASQPSAIANTAVSPAGAAAFSGGNYYVLLDGMRFENISDMENNPLYGMTAYSTIQSTDTFTNAVSTIVPVTKDTNTNSLLEFKLNLELNAEG